MHMYLALVTFYYLRTYIKWSPIFFYYKSVNFSNCPINAINIKLVFRKIYCMNDLSQACFGLVYKHY